MSGEPFGTILGGSREGIAQAYKQWAEHSVDHDVGATLNPSSDTSPTFDKKETTLREKFSITGPGTFFGRAQRTLTFLPTTEKGWWFSRTDLPDQMPIHVTVNNVWTTVRNIVLCSGSPHNYMRMVEHIIALKPGLGLDNVMIEMDSGDPPLFDRSSMDLVEAIEKAGMVSAELPAPYVTVKEPVTIGGNRGDFLTILPAEKDCCYLDIDCAIDFPTAIGKQRIKFRVNGETFRHGAFARTNTSLWMMLYCKTIGKIFADTRNLGYTTRNILVAGPNRYVNEPRIMHGKKSLEAVWHRAVLDLLAAVALIDRGRLAGKIVSYKAGHALDVQMMRELYNRDLLTEMR